MNLTHEILDVLSKESGPLSQDDLFGSLTPPKDSAHNWRTKVTHGLRVLDELDFTDVRDDAQLLEVLKGAFRHELKRVQEEKDNARIP